MISVASSRLTPKLAAIAARSSLVRSSCRFVIVASRRVVVSSRLSPSGAAAPRSRTFTSFKFYYLGLASPLCPQGSDRPTNQAVPQHHTSLTE